MILVIPANTDFRDFAEFHRLADWLAANGVDITHIDGSRPVTIRTDRIEWSRPLDGFGAPASMPVVVPIPDGLMTALATRFGASYTEGDVLPAITPDQRLSPDEETAPLDDIAVMIDRLRQARADSKAAKEREDEAKAEILARLKATGREYGSVNGQRVVHAKPVTSNTFQTVKFRSAHPELAAEFTEAKTSIRLEIV